MTPAQIKRFWPLFSAACRNLGLKTSSEKEEYRHRLMWDADRADHLADVSNGIGYDRIMSALSADAGDFLAASAAAGGSTRRFAAIIDDCARQVFELSGKTGDRMEYAKGILLQSGYAVPPSDQWWMDLPESTFFKIFFSLDTYRRRLVSARRASTGVSCPISYKFGRSWL